MYDCGGASAGNEQSEDLKTEVSFGDIVDLINRMKAALVDYDLSETDSVIEMLDKIQLPESVLETYQKAKKYYEDMEYEDALSLREY